MLGRHTAIGAALLATSTFPLIVACSSPGEPEPPGAPVAIISADTLHAGTVMAPLTDSLVVKVADAKGRGVPRQQVEWIVLPEAGEVSPTQVLTDERGFARTAWTLGRNAGDHTATARMVTADGPRTVQFSAVASPGALATFEVSPEAPVIGTEQQVRLTAVPYDVHGNATGRRVVWSSSNVEIATVDSTGLVHGVAPGTVQVSAATEGRTVQATVTVLMRATLVASDTVRAGTVGQALAEPLVVRLVDPRGRGIARQQVTWSVLSPGATLAGSPSLTDEEGFARATLTLGRTSGSYHVSASAVTGFGVVTARFRAVAAAGPVNSVEVSPSPIQMAAGQSRQLTATLTDQYGNRVTDAAVTWVSSNTAVARVDSQTGMVYAVALGTALIEATAQGKLGVTRVFVDPVYLLRDNFNTENGGNSQDNYTGFAHWEVVDGTVDLVGTGRYDDFLPPENGVGVDLDGTTNQAGTLRSRATFVLDPGEYTLVFQLAGTPRVSEPNTVVVSLGDVYRESFTLKQFDPLRTISRTVTIPAPTTARLEFAHQGGDNYGILLDDVQLFRKP